MKYKVYTDGAYSSSLNQGGIGFIILKDNIKIFEYSKKYKNTTNNRMELLSCILALESIVNPSEIEVISDSMYLVGTCTKGWKKKKNVDLWSRLEKAISKHKKVYFSWVKGHNGDKYNSECDILAQEASQEL